MTHFLQTHGKTLRELHLGGGFIVTDTLLQVITQTAPRLRYLALTDRALRITDKGLIMIATSMFHLEKLFLRYPHNITTEGISILAHLSHNHNLHSIRILGNRKSGNPMSTLEEGTFPESCSLTYTGL